MFSLESKDWVTVLSIAIPQFAAIILALINRRKLKSIENQVNGKMTELMQATKEAAHAVGHEAGRVEGRAEERKEVKEREG
jgi:hypothetical protein